MMDYQFSIEYIGDLRTKSIHHGSSSEIITDAPIDNEGLGRAIAGAVQAELQTQKRSGGILNPYGAA